ncbi:hypothetical protein FK531_06245 [Rhodococcus spelaei]|uniref:Permease n=1 Tax=Rhodococcus spelaei TaxID=2546320 RepID=A0A541BPK0_9NOCA|nr:hypothetical protein [Rhodococcus spelaei]TQF74235.1 hypothetical protein FK531_06245 [Rhodococcus spelaei]
MTNGSQDGFAERPVDAGRTGLPGWAKKAIAGAVLLVVLVITYFVLAAFLPRWWAQQAGSLSSGSFTRGIAWGLLYGVLCTLLPLLLIQLAWRVRGRKFSRAAQIASVVLAVILALPNLMTLTVVLGNNTAAHAGERILDVDAPGFRGASLVGAIIGVLAFAVLVWLGVAYRRRGRELSRMRDQARATEQQTSARSESPGEG